MSEVLDPADGFEPALAVQASAKLTLLHQLLPLLQRAGRHVLLLSQSHQVPAELLVEPTGCLSAASLTVLWSCTLPSNMQELEEVIFDTL